MFYSLVRKFQKAFGHPAPDKATPLTLERTVARGGWTVEEIVEMIQQTSKDEAEFDSAIDILKLKLDAAVIKSKNDDYNSSEKDVMIGQLDALIDQLVFVNGSLAEMGIDPKPFYQIVMDANMAKLGPDGKPIIRESDGKIMKPEGWEPPEPKMLEKLNEILDSESK